MQVVESLTQLAVSAGNAAIGVATMKQQAAMAGIGMLQHATGSDNGKNTGKNGNANQPNGDTSAQNAQAARNTQPNAANISDPATVEVNRVLQLTRALEQLICGGPNGGPNWDMIRGDVRSRTFTGRLQSTDKGGASRAVQMRRREVFMWS